MKIIAYPCGGCGRVILVKDLQPVVLHQKMYLAGSCPYCGALTILRNGIYM